MTLRESLLLTDLRQYLLLTGPPSLLQLVLLIAVVHLLLSRSLRGLGWVRQPLQPHEKVTDDFVWALATVNMGLGVVFTFSGALRMMTGVSGNNGGIELALGSSMLGYSTYAICPLGALVDRLRHHFLEVNRDEPCPSNVVRCGRHLGHSVYRLLRPFGILGDPVIGSGRHPSSPVVDRTHEHRASLGDGAGDGPVARPRSADGAAGDRGDAAPSQRAR